MIPRIEHFWNTLRFFEDRERGAFLRKKPFECVLSVQSNSENAKAGSAFWLERQCQVDQMRVVIRVHEIPAIDAGKHLLQCGIDAVRGKKREN